jgi:hypothetical protein
MFRSRKLGSRIHGAQRLSFEVPRCSRPRRVEARGLAATPIRDAAALGLAEREIATFAEVAGLRVGRRGKRAGRLRPRIAEIGAPGAGRAGEERDRFAAAVGLLFRLARRGASLLFSWGQAQPRP